jgi:hypothetical protein
VQKCHGENSNPGKVWTAKGVHRRQNKDDSLCKSGMAKKEPLQKCSDPKKLWTAEEIDRHWHKDDPLCKIGMAQGTQSGRTVGQTRTTEEAEQE